MSTDTAPTPTGANGICIAFSNNWDSDNTHTTWTRIDDPSVPSLTYTGSGATAKSHMVSNWTTDRGRSYELDKTQSGTATVTLQDTSGIFDPTNPASPYANFIGPMKRATINVQVPGTNPVQWADVFTGYLESYDWVVDQAQKIMTVTLHLVDGFEPLTRAEVVPDGTGTTTYAAQQVDDRIFALLADAQWPSGLTNVNTGNVDLQATVYNPGTQILGAIQDAADAEFPYVANVYMDRHGNVAFRGRWPRFQPATYTNQVHFWTAGDRQAANTFGYAPISEIGWNLDQKDLYNAALVFPYGIPQASISGQLVTDPTSISTYGVRSISINDLIVQQNLVDVGHGFPILLDANATCLLYSNYYIGNFNTPVQRISNLVFKTVDPNGGTPNTALWNMMCNVEIGDVITVITNNPGGGGMNPYTRYGNQFFVEGIHNVVNPLSGELPDWTMTLDVSPRAWFSTFNGISYYTP